MDHLDEDVKLQIREIVTSAVKNALEIANIHNPEEHAAQHEAIKSIIDERRWRTEMYRRICENLIGWGVLGFATVIGAALLGYAKAKLNG